MTRFLVILCLLPLGVEGRGGRESPEFGDCVACPRIMLGAEQAQLSKCVIEGTIVNELTGEGVRRAEVVARRMSERSQTGGRFGTIETLGIGVYTDGGGAFRIDNLEPGRYQVEVRKAGYLLPPNRRTEEMLLTLSAGQVRTGLRIGMLPQGVIAGRVVDEEGEPLRGVTVTAMRTRYARGRRSWSSLGSGTTNDRGEYRITELRGGRYFLMAQIRESRSALFRTSEGRASAFVPTWFPGTPDVQQAQPVNVSPGTETGGFDIRMVRDQVFRITGNVTGSDGRPLTNYTALVSPAESEGGSVAGAVARDAEGRFEFAGLRSGTWLISVQPMEQGEGERSVGVARVEVRGGDVENVAIRVTPRMAITGTVEVQGDGVADITKAQVGLVASEAAPFGSSPAAPVVADGSFRVSANAPIRYLIQAWGEPAPNAYLAGVRIGTEEYLGRDLDLSQGPPGPVRILFRTDGAAVKVASQALDEALARHRLYAFMLPIDEGLRRLGSPPMVEVRQGEQTQFRGVRPGEYWVFVADDADAGSWDLAAEVPDFESKAARVKAEANGAHAVEVKSVISLSGQ